MVFCPLTMIAGIWRKFAKTALKPRKTQEKYISLQMRNSHEILNCGN